MAIALAVFGISYAALAVWLTVRIVNRRERWAKRVLAAVAGLPVLYIASFAPLLWLDAKGYIANGSLFHDACRFYATPVRVAYETGPAPIRDALNWYQSVFR